MIDFSAIADIGLTFLILTLGHATKLSSFLKYQNLLCNATISAFPSHQDRTFQKPQDFAEFNPDTLTEALFA